MERSPDTKEQAKQETLKREDRKHEGARENRPERPQPVEGEKKYTDEERRRDGQERKKRDDQGNEVPAKDAEKVERLDKTEDAAVEDEADTDKDETAEGESSNVVKTVEDDDEKPSQGI